jgi:hypothetical protein
MLTTLFDTLILEDNYNAFRFTLQQSNSYLIDLVFPVKVQCVQDHFVVDRLMEAEISYATQ